MSFIAQLKALGFDSYEGYLASEHWKEFKRQYMISGKRAVCMVCNSTHIELHHHTYERLGCERLDDVHPLCAIHHDAVHKWLSNRNLSVSNSMDALRSMGVKEGTVNEYGVRVIPCQKQSKWNDGAGVYGSKRRKHWIRQKPLETDKKGIGKMIDRLAKEAKEKR